MIAMHIVGAVMIVTVGYFVLWTASLSSAPKGVAGFGKVMAIILFIIAGCMLIGGIVFGPKMHSMMMHKMEMGGMKDACGEHMYMNEDTIMEKESVRKGMMKK
ncbi:MAG: hypothetical protein A3J83_08685 [Elusimicrobia bacterium RIFOXYA2_FULL_40_6]|nr:MAG: hypothetical protein A3J83_08685 [Elusimicrobia bacterium RIFOXYA2_FULL_40_6]